MQEIFADTNYWIAIFNESDSLHKKATLVSQSLASDTFIFTSQLVLGEVIEHFSARSVFLRKKVLDVIANIEDDPYFAVEPMTPKLFEDTITFYRRHADKEWGFVDCSSFVIMKRRSIKDALTYDHHFVQAGFRALLRD
ncbi:MAG TPA: PIN domain-containing protein [Candidatus Kapabacteria bacterium]|nr:PIN domain-containing protein [Candidatus Kapabacteria bacterium]